MGRPRFSELVFEDIDGCVRADLFFGNGYGVSVLQNKPRGPWEENIEGVYGNAEDDTYEVAVLVRTSDGGVAEGETPITPPAPNNYLDYQSRAQVEEVLRKVERLPVREELRGFRPLERGTFGEVIDFRDARQVVQSLAPEVGVRPEGLQIDVARDLMSTGGPRFYRVSKVGSRKSWLVAEDLGAAEGVVEELDVLRETPAGLVYWEAR
jgi:hypothetical protein